MLITLGVGGLHSILTLLPPSPDPSLAFLQGNRDESIGIDTQPGISARDVGGVHPKSPKSASPPMVPRAVLTQLV